MLKTIEGIFRNGRIELLEAAPDVAVARVVVTFLPTSNSIDLAKKGSTRSRQPISADGWVHLSKNGIVRIWTYTMRFKRGDVVLVLFPDSNLRTANGARRW